MDELRTTKYVLAANAIEADAAVREPGRAFATKLTARAHLAGFHSRRQHTDWRVFGGSDYLPRMPRPKCADDLPSPCHDCGAVDRELVPCPSARCLNETCIVCLRRCCSCGMDHCSSCLTRIGLELFCPDCAAAERDRIIAGIERPAVWLFCLLVTVWVLAGLAYVAGVRQ